MAVMQDFKSALALTNANKHRIYVKRAGDGSSGFERSIEAAFPDVAVKPKFKIDASAPVFTIGSCFARNIEAALYRKGFDIITRQCSIPGELYELTGLGARNGALNAYTAHSMLDLLRWPERPDRYTMGTLDLGGNQWADMMVSGLRNLSSEELALVRNQILGTYEALSGARTVIITLGYTESWFDTQDNIFVNKSPAGSRSTLKSGSRYQFMNADAASISSALDEIIAVIRRKTSDQAQIVLTTSPVPLHGTFTDRDVICANLYSKATLLSSAVNAAERYEYVDYYPSYEMVTYASADDAWEDDGVHVKPSLVEKVLERFVDAYVS